MNSKLFPENYNKILVVWGGFIFLALKEEKYPSNKKITSSAS